MKNLYKFILLSTIYASISVQLITAQSATINLNKAGNGNQLHEATQNVTLDAGFSYDAQSKNTFNARVVPANGQAYSFTEPTDNSALNTNTAYPVGTIEGSWSVSPSGGASYSIPIKLPPGINGMVPGLSIVYSSQSGEGLLGLGWNVSGLSGISRAASDLYHETYINNIQFNANDHFVLDGQRLIPVLSRTTGISEYRTENESFSRIIAYGGTAGDPTYFKVETKDGKVIEYGNSTDSRIEAQGLSTALVWNVDKISDKNGNYITMTYSENNSTGEYYPLTINYTGTTNIVPFNTIQFEYQTRTNPFVSYVSGSKVTLNSLIKNIYLKNEGITVSQFQFLYNTANSRLSEIIEFGKNNSRLNSSMVNWGTANTGLAESTAFTDPQVSGRYQGDFNGDGFQDFVIVKSTTWYLYLANGTGNLTFTSSGALANYSHDVSTGDFNGDGKQDLIEHVLQNGKYYDHILISAGNSFTRLGLNPNYYLESDNPDFKIGDFDGDGMDEQMVKFPNYTSPTNNCIIKKYTIVGSSHSSSIIASTWIEWANTAWYIYIKEVPLDMNGNGKTDLMVLDANGSRFYEYENGIINQICSISYPNINNVNLFGDFNGDGKIDIFSFDQYNTWKVSISKGNGFETPRSITVFNGWSPYTTTNNYYARDIDGDGKSDLVVVGYGNSGSQVKIYVACSDGQNFNLQTYSPPTILGMSPGYFGDFTGDGTIDYYYDDGSIARMYTIYRGINQNLISSIKNGLGLSSGVTYKPLTDYMVYTKGTTSQYPIMDFQGATYVASSVWTDDVPGTQDITNYKYSTAIIHRKGKGFLGFQQVTSSNSLHNTQIFSQYEYNPTYFNTSLKQVNVNNASGGSSISQVVNTNSLIDFGNKRILPYVSQSVGNDYTGGITKTTLTSIDNNGNPSSATETFDDGSYNTTTWSNFSSEGSWMPARPQNVTITKKHYLDVSTFSLSSAYTYQTGTGLLLTDVTGPLTSTYLYNGDGTPSQVTQSDGLTNRTTRFEYDTKGRFVAKTYNALNHPTQRTYDNATGNVLTLTEPNTKVTSYTYDDFGRQTGATSPTTQSVAMSWNWATGNRPSNAIFYKLTTSTGLPSTKEYYDGFGRVLRTETTGFNGTSIYSSAVYNAIGQVTQSSLPFYIGQAALANNYSYDDYGRLIFDAGPSGIAAYTYTGKSTQSVTGSGHVLSGTSDSQGNVVSSTDEGGTINYTYRSIGKPWTITTNGATVTMSYDSYGRQIGLTDPDAGSSAYSYNGYNELSSQIDAKNNSYNITYDLLGRIATRTGSEGATTYSYDPANNPGLLSSVIYPGGSESYTYDTYGRLSGKSKIINDGSANTYNFGYGYDNQGRMTSVTYPSAFAVTNVYNSYGYLSEIRRTSNNALIWKGLQTNALEQLTQYQYGNNLTTNKTYNNIGLLTNIQTGTVQNLNYNFDPGTGNLLSRSDVSRSLSETFAYDNVDRLNDISGPAPLGISYENNGNISAKSMLGGYVYGSLPHAVTRVANVQNLISNVTQNVAYTPFEKVENISEGTSSLQYTYDGSRQRAISKLYQSSTLQKTTHYVGSYEKETIGSNVRQLHYIAGGDDLAAIYALNNGVDTMYYMHTDHLGSFDVITNQSGAAIKNYSFDAWGRIRNPTNWTYNNIPSYSLFSRGYTGHEHLDNFSLINMNGRVYDPLIGRFLSPDNFVQDPSSSQSYNRYSYCMNNPLKYTDPSGNSAIGNVFRSLFTAVFGGAGASSPAGAAGESFGESMGKALVYGYRIGFTTMSVVGMVAGAPAWAMGISSFTYNHSLTGNWNYWDLAPTMLTGLGLGANELGKSFILNQGRFSDRLLGGNVELNARDGFILIGHNISDAGNFVGNGMNLANTVGQNSVDFTGDPPGGSFLNKTPRQDFSGFWGGANYLMTGGNISGLHYDYSTGKATGLAPIGGIAPTPGFRGGTIFIKGFGSVNKGLFHTVIKKKILKSAGDFYKVVGTNPDITVKEGLIILKGTGPYSGKVYQSGLNVLDFFGL